MKSKWPRAWPKGEGAAAGSATQAAREEMQAEIERFCAAEVPGDTHRNLQVVINGYTGAIAGKYPKSWIKITLAVAAILAMAALLALVLGHR